MPKKTSTSARMNHKTPEAAQARAKLDVAITKMLATTPAGIGKMIIATKLKVDATLVKASLNRLVKAGVAKTVGSTNATLYIATLYIHKG